MSKSNDNGRVLEYLIVNEIIKVFGSKVSLSENTIREQKRDFDKVPGVKENVIKNMKLSTVKITTWIKSIVTYNNLLVERLIDGEGTNGDVTDIRISYGEEVLNLSIKHNHMALKHQRPMSTPQHFNFNKGSEIDVDFRKEYLLILEKFRNHVLSYKPNIVLYKEVVDVIPELLYLPICELVSKFINKHGVETSKSNDYLKFLVGNTNFKKVIVFPNSTIKIMSFDNIPQSHKTSSIVKNNSHVEVDFNNGIVLSMRLHTASSRFSQNSLKFDTKTKIFDVPFIEL